MNRLSRATGIASSACSPACALAGEWLLHSGIQEPHGGLARYHRISEARNARVSTEITGYGVSAYLELHERSADPRYLEAARRAGDFLCRAWDERSEAMPFEWVPDGEPPEQLSCFFDNGIIARALLRLWRATGEPRYRRTAELCAESMERDFVNSHDIHPVLALPSKQPLPRDGRWSRSSGCYQLKSALAWLEVAAAGGEQRLNALFDRACEFALGTHSSFLDAAPDDRARMDRLHAYCYFLEALLWRGDQSRAREALAVGIARAGAELRRIRPVFERSDVNAQLLRVRLWAHHLGLAPLDEAAAAEEARRVASFQMTGADARLRGGYNFGALTGEPSDYANPVSTAFCLQALAMWDEFRSGGLKTPVDRLI